MQWGWNSFEKYIFQIPISLQKSANIVMLGCFSHEKRVSQLHLSIGILIFK